MYSFLHNRFRPEIADALAVIWYVVLFFLMYLFSYREDPGFVYLNL
ncbi:MAG: hypothetical protein KKB51_09365 [Candidatus Riflebacteria bacterium]|nr:hypothetical protein [Candidatus Riflebacteria bacterium]